MHLTVASDAVVVVAGVPGAGKSTLIDRTVDRGRVRVVDTEDQRRAGRASRFLLVRIAVHYARITAAVLGRRPVVIHSRGTAPAARRAIAVLARLRRRTPYLLLLDAAPAEAIAGQESRGRTIGAPEMARHVAAFAALRRDGAARLAVREGWREVLVLTRADAARIDTLGPADARECAGDDPDPEPRDPRLPGWTQQPRSRASAA